MANTYEISEIRARQIRLAKLKEILGEQMHRVVIPLIDIPEEELDYILPALLTRPIDDLTIDELDDLLNGHKKFFVLR